MLWDARSDGSGAAGLLARTVSAQGPTPITTELRYDSVGRVTGSTLDIQVFGRFALGLSYNDVLDHCARASQLVETADVCSLRVDRRLSHALPESVVPEVGRRAAEFVDLYVMDSPRLYAGGALDASSPSADPGSSK
jgi:hypothetical protein